VTSLFVVACGSSSSPSGTTSGAASSKPDKKLHIAYFSFAVQNSYDAPMLAAARKAAAAGNADLTVFDANNAGQKQFSQVQDALATGSYDGLVIQSVDGAGLVPLVKEAVRKHVRVVALGTVLGAELRNPAPQVPGVAASIVQTGYDRGVLEGKLVKQACASLKTSNCNVGYMYDVKASGYDQGVRSGFDSVVSQDPRIKVVAEGQAFFTANGGLQAAQTMLQAHPEINVMGGSDQDMQGAGTAIAKAGRKVAIVGVGGSVAGLKNVASGKWFGDVVTLPATEGKTAVDAVIGAIRTGQARGAVNVESQLTRGGIATQDNVGDFKGEWPG
jgi:ribose transport system substrate-binding protein